LAVLAARSGGGGGGGGVAAGGGGGGGGSAAPSVADSHGKGVPPDPSFESLTGVRGRPPSCGLDEDAEGGRPGGSDGGAAGHPRGWGAALCAAQRRALAVLQRTRGGRHRFSLWDQCVAEAIGTAMIVVFGVGVVCTATLTDSAAGLWQVATVWGFGVALAILCTASVSGAHLNPAVSLAFALFRPDDFPWRKLLPYWAAQYAGGVLGGALNLALFGPLFTAFEAREGIVRGEGGSVVTAAAFGEYFPNPGFAKTVPASAVSPAFALAVEAWGTGVLMFVILAIIDGRQKLMGGKEMIPFYIGFTVAVLISLYAPLTQAGWNPARDVRWGRRAAVVAGGGGSLDGAWSCALFARRASLCFVWRRLWCGTRTDVCAVRLLYLVWFGVRLPHVCRFLIAQFGPRVVAALAGWGSIAIPGPRNGYVGLCLLMGTLGARLRACVPQRRGAVCPLGSRFVLLTPVFCFVELRSCTVVLSSCPTWFLSAGRLPDTRPKVLGVHRRPQDWRPAGRPGVRHAHCAGVGPVGACGRGQVC